MKKLTALALILMLLLSCAFAEEAAVREPAPYNYAISGEDNYVENLIFNGDVIISGDYAQIIFANCQFNGDIINTADNYTRVFIMPDCEINGSLILRNSTQEATIDSPIPKFVLFAPAPVVTEDCIGAVLALGSFDINFNGVDYTMSQAEYYADPSSPNGVVPYEGQEADVFLVGRWWENGEEVIFTYCEDDPTM